MLSDVPHTPLPVVGLPGLMEAALAAPAPGETPPRAHWALFAKTGEGGGGCRD